MERYHYYNDKLKIANDLGHKTISEALVFEYRKTKSARKVGVLFGMTSNGVRFALHRIGEPVQGHGGYRKGDIRHGRVPNEEKKITDLRTWTKTPGHKNKKFKN